MKAKLVRYHSGEDATLGVLRFPWAKHAPIFTLELPWKDNRNDISCIPPGLYTCAPYSSEKYPDVYQVLDVPGREAILIHIGNYPKDTHGCILPGLGVVPNTPMVSSSASAMNLIKSIVHGSKFQLEIMGV